MLLAFFISLLQFGSISVGFDPVPMHVPPLAIVIPKGKPKDFKPVTYKVKWLDNEILGDGGETYCGMTHTDVHEIDVWRKSDPDCPDPAETLDHEVMHAIQNEGGRGSQKHWGYHSWIYFMSPRMVWTLRHNPELSEYLLHAR